jgi:hypothetical protein
MPHGGKFANKQAAWICSGLLSLLTAGFATAAPSIIGTSGTFNHKSSVTVSGTGFGSKATAAPVVWDDASVGTLPTDNGNWDGGWPMQGPLTNGFSSPTYYIRYTTPINGVPLPHSHVTRYLAGAHGESGSGGYDVMVWKYRTNAVPGYLYASWYSRAATNWTYAISPPDAGDNYKSFDYSVASGAYDSGGHYYGGLNPLTNNTMQSQWGCLGQYGLIPAINPMSGVWIKTEIEMKASQGGDGFFRIYENGQLMLTYNGPTDGPNAVGQPVRGAPWPGTDRSFTVGGYSNPHGQPTNWRYFGDIYLDYTLARVVLANDADLTKATITEPQLPTRWTSSSVTFSANVGQHATGKTAYLFVVDPSGAHNTTGFPVTVGTSGGSSSTIPDPPSDVAVH